MNLAIILIRPHSEKVKLNNKTGGTLHHEKEVDVF